MARQCSKTLFLSMMMLAILAAVASAAPVFPFPPTQPGSQTPAPAADPRLAQIRQGLESKGLRVLEVELHRLRDGDTQWWAETATAYAQPSREKVLEQTFTIWGVMYETVGQDDLQAILAASQVWTKYSIVFRSRMAGLIAFVKAYQAARSDAERDQAFNAFIREVRVLIWDRERNQAVDQKDFINKNFTR
ncbi:MAG: hypothetical protein ACRDGM_10570 [bacterium]